MELSGRVRDKTVIRAQSLEVKLERTDGRLEVTFGECELAVGEAPDKAVAVREATSGGPRVAASAPAGGAPAATEGGEVTAEADASPSARNLAAANAPTTASGTSRAPRLGKFGNRGAHATRGR